ncbi:MAG: GMC family oxidoreductase [Bryobacteraceae bacterium]|nr:GMC family oxidoreductase [Bryobacteraceae bacterium]
MAQIAPPRQIFDAIVVGSGATGGWAAKELAEAGMSVAVLEAGPKITPKDFSEHVQPYQLKYRGNDPHMLEKRPIQGLVYACRESNQEWFVNDIENPYKVDEGKPFNWIRMRVLGGRSLSWGRQSYRMGDIDFKAASRDGWGEDWPITHAEMKPYYERVERYIGISGNEENYDVLPDSVFQPPMAMTCGEEVLRDKVKAKMGRIVTIGRVAILTKPLNGRQPCHYCGPCEQGCSTFSYYSSPWTTLKAAGATGKLTLVTDAVASHIVMDKATGKASGIAYIDRTTRVPREIRAKVIVLCASTLESTRLLLNSAPGGLANSSGALGKYLMDHIYGGGAAGEMPMLRANPWFGPPRRPNGIYVPRFRNVKETTTNGFIRGYGFQGGSSPNFAMGAEGFGADFKKAVRENGKWTVNLGVWGECLARPENFVEVNKDQVDAWGIPTLKIHMKWSDNELKLFEDARIQAAEMLEAAGATNVIKTGRPSVPGFCIHEIGTARMGSDPKKSVLNAYNQTHDVKNIFVTDGAAYVSSACQNPTLTMMAITVRACDHIKDRFKKGEL